MAHGTIRRSHKSTGKGIAWIVPLLTVVAACGLDTGGTRGGEWVTSLRPDFACAKDQAVATWDDRIYCSPGLYGSGIGGAGAADFFRAQCPPYPQVTISDGDSPATVYVDSSRDERGSTHVRVDPTIQVFFNANPVVYSSPGTSGRIVALPRHIHSVEVIPPDHPHIFAAMADGACVGSRPGWTDAVIDVRPDEVRSLSTQALRVCNRAAVAAVFELATKDGRTRRETIGPRSCINLTDFWPGELAEVTSRGGLDVGFADCSPTRSIPPVPIVFDVTVGCPARP